MWAEISSSAIITIIMVARLALCPRISMSRAESSPIRHLLGHMSDTELWVWQTLAGYWHPSSSAENEIDITLLDVIIGISGKSAPLPITACNLPSRAQVAKSETGRSGSVGREHPCLPGSFILFILTVSPCSLVLFSLRLSSSYCPSLCFWGQSWGCRRKRSVRRTNCERLSQLEAKIIRDK